MILAILQARMSSSRLPGKVLKKVNDKPILYYQIERIKKSSKIDKLVVATSVNVEDNDIELLCKENDIECFRGDLKNVLDRYYKCAKLFKADIVVRLTGDCPVTDFNVIDEVISLHQNSNSDYTSNTLERTFPDGLDVEVFNFNVLESIYHKAKDPEDLEHVTKYIHGHKNEYKLANYKNDIDYSYIRWTLDTLEDFYFFKHFYESKKNLNFGWKELLSITTENKKFLIDSNQTIRYAMKKLEEIVNDDIDSLYVISNKKIIGTLSTSDIRRALIYGDVTNNDQVIKVINKNFHYLEYLRQYNKDELLKLLRYGILPVLNEDFEFIEFKSVKQMLTKNNIVVLMAGGLGSRLGKITEKIPKPMLSIGGKPILQTIIEQFKTYMFSNFYISVNYMADQIIDFFNNGNTLDVNIKYLVEKQKLGTAGCLSMLDKDSISEPFILMNGDILTNVNFEDILNFHETNKYDVTIATISYNIQIPYGVISKEGNNVCDIIEKPIKTYETSAGIYVLSPNVLKYVPDNEKYDITSLFDELIKDGKKIGTYKINGYWLDIGKPDDFYKAHQDFACMFQ